MVKCPTTHYSRCLENPKDVKKFTERAKSAKEQAEKVSRVHDVEHSACPLAGSVRRNLTAVMERQGISQCLQESGRPAGQVNADEIV